MKKVLCFLLIVAMLLGVLAMTGCSKEAEESTKKTGSSQMDDESETEEKNGWKVNIFVASTAEAMEHEPVVDMTTTDGEQYYVNFRLSGGTPGEEFQGTYVITFSDNTTKTGSIEGKKAGSMVTVLVPANDHPAGDISVIVFDKDGVVLGENTASVKLSEAQKPVTSDIFGITYEGVRIELGAPASPVVNALPNRLSIETEGDYRYFRYRSVYIRTQKIDEVYYIESFWFLDVGVKTDEGITLFNTKEEMEAAYGADSYSYTSESGADYYEIIRNGGKLEIKLAGNNSVRPAGTVDSIKFSVITE